MLPGTTVTPVLPVTMFMHRVSAMAFPVKNDIHHGVVVETRSNLLVYIVDSNSGTAARNTASVAEAIVLMEQTVTDLQQAIRAYRQHDTPERTG